MKRRFRDCLPPAEVLALALYHLADRNSYSVIGLVFNVGKSRISSFHAKSTLVIINYKFPPIQVHVSWNCNRSNQLAVTAPEAASFVFLNIFKISLPHSCTTVSLKFGRFSQFFSNWRKAGRIRKREKMTDF